MFQQTGSKLTAPRVPPQPADPSPPRRSISQSGNSSSVHNGSNRFHNFYDLFSEKHELYFASCVNRCTVAGSASSAASSSGAASFASISTHFWSDFNFIHFSQVNWIIKFTRKSTTWRSCFNRTPESSQMTPITPSSSLSGQHVPFSFSTPHDMATNGSPRHSIASNSSGLSNPPSPGVTSHLRDSRDSYESWIFSLDCHVEEWFFFFFPHRKYLNKTWRILFICHRLLKTRDRVVFLIIIIKKK